MNVICIYASKLYAKLSNILILASFFLKLKILKAF